MEFSQKQTSLIGGATKNAFIKEGLKKSNETVSGNGALKYSTTGNDFVDNFANISSFKQPRDYAEVSKDMNLLWSINPKKCLQLAFYIRLITRETQVNEKDKATETLEVQKGQGLKNEGIMRMLWLAINHKATFTANIPYYLAAGCWKDIIEMMSLDLQYHGWKDRKLDWIFLKDLIIAGLANPATSELVKKYLPTIKPIKECTTLRAQSRTLIGRFLATCIFGKPTEKLTKESIQRQYRLLKSGGTAHVWQQLISKEDYLHIDFDTIHGRALSLLVGSKFLANHNLEEKYTKWIESKPVAKYTGYPYELLAPISHGITNYQEMTINKQFAQLVENGKKNTAVSKLLVVRDTSGSMTSIASGTKVSSFDIAKGLALYFSEMMPDGPFHNVFAEFNNSCILHEWKGNTPVEKWKNDHCSCYGSTNFLGVATLLCEIRKTVNENEFPDGVLCVSDGEFDYNAHKATTFNRFKEMLLEGGFSKEFVNNFKLILWDVPNGYYGKHECKFEDFADAPNFFYMSGYDPSTIGFIMGTSKGKVTPRNAAELFEAAMDQDLLNRLVVIQPKKFNKNKTKVSKKRVAKK